MQSTDSRVSLVQNLATIDQTKKIKDKTAEMERVNEVGNATISELTQACEKYEKHGISLDSSKIKCIRNGNICLIGSVVSGIIASIAIVVGIATSTILWPLVIFAGFLIIGGVLFCAANNYRLDTLYALNRDIINNANANDKSNSAKIEERKSVLVKAWQGVYEIECIGGSIRDSLGKIKPGHDYALRSLNGNSLGFKHNKEALSISQLKIMIDDYKPKCSYEGAINDGSYFTDNDLEILFDSSYEDVIDYSSYFTDNDLETLFENLNRRLPEFLDGQSSTIAEIKKLVAELKVMQAVNIPKQRGRLLYIYKISQFYEKINALNERVLSKEADRVIGDSLESIAGDKRAYIDFVKLVMSQGETHICKDLIINTMLFNQEAFGLHLTVDQELTLSQSFNIEDSLDIAFNFDVNGQITVSMKLKEGAAFPEVIVSNLLSADVSEDDVIGRLSSLQVELKMEGVRVLGDDDGTYLDFNFNLEQSNVAIDFVPERKLMYS